MLNDKKHVEFNLEKVSEARKIQILFFPTNPEEKGDSTYFLSHSQSALMLNTLLVVVSTEQCQNIIWIRVYIRSIRILRSRNRVPTIQVDNAGPDPSSIGKQTTSALQMYLLWTREI